MINRFWAITHLYTSIRFECTSQEQKKKESRTVNRTIDSAIRSVLRPCHSRPEVCILANSQLLTGQYRARSNANQIILLCCWKQLFSVPLICATTLEYVVTRIFESNWTTQHYTTTDISCFLSMASFINIIRVIASLFKMAKSTRYHIVQFEFRQWATILCLILKSGTHTLNRYKIH